MNRTRMNVSPSFSSLLLFPLLAAAVASADPPATLPATVASPTTVPTTLPSTLPSTVPSTLRSTASSALPATRPAADLAALIARLGGDDWRDRQKAEDQLVQLGDEARPALKKAAAESEGTEQRTRAAVALARIDEIAANGPTLVTLHFKDVNPKVVVAELSRQAGAPIKVWPEEMWDRNNGGGFAGMFGRKPKVTIDVDKQPFWLAVAEFCEKTNVRPQEMGFNQGITLMQGGSATLDCPRCTSGQFIVTATGAQRNRSIQFGPGGARQSADSLSLQVYVDPKAKVLAYSYDPDVTEAVDDKGNSLGTHKAGLNGMSQMQQRPFTFSLSLPLTYPDDGYSKLAKLKGKIPVLLASKTETLEIPDMEKALHAPKTAAGRTVEVKEAKITGNSLSYRLLVRRAGMPLAQWRGMFNDLQGVRITDAKGNTYNGGAGGSLSDTECEASGNVSTSVQIQGPLKLVWEMTVETKQDSIQFDFKDLPLPTP